MKKTNIYFFLMLIVILLLVFCSISASSLLSSVILRSTGIISSMPGPTYSILQTGTVTNVVNETSGTIVYSNAKANLAFSAAFGYVASGGNIIVRAGTYWANGSSLFMRNCQNVNVTFQPNAILTITDWVNASVFQMWNNSNCIISNIQINGNAQHQISYSSICGILVGDCSNCTVISAKITNCRASGYLVGNNNPTPLPNGIVDSTVTFCGWNGISLGWGGSYTRGAYAINNTVAYCSDVGITAWQSLNSRIINNYVYDMNGTTGDVNSHDGIDIEYGANYSIVEHNTIVNCVHGIWSATGVITPHSNLIAYNNVTNCRWGIFSGSPNDVITQNYVKNWGDWSGGGIQVDQNNIIVSFNILINTNASVTGPAITIGEYSGVTNCSACNNTITTQVASGTPAIYVELGSNSSIIEGNNVQASVGVQIYGAQCTSNIISGNNLVNCTTGISNSGTGTIVNPTSSATYTLTFSNLYDGSSQGRYAYSNTTDIIFTVTSGGILNVDGSNVTLTNNAYVLLMNKDHFVYAIGGTVTFSARG